MDCASFSEGAMNQDTENEEKVKFDTPKVRAK
jgi:hypothetical protein